MTRLNIIGASGHGKVVADIAKLNGYSDIAFFDDNKDVKECLGFPVLGASEEATEGEVFVAIGNSKIRKKLMEFYKDRVQPVLIHPNAVVADSVTLEKGTVVMAGSVINPDAKIGKGCIINSCSSVDHDCLINDYVHVAVGAHVCGTVTVGEMTWIGAGATIINNVSICSECFIGAGATVVKDVDCRGKYLGIPAKKYEDIDIS